MTFEMGVHKLEGCTVEQVIEDLSREGWKVFVLHGAEIVDQRALWAAASRDLVLAPPLGSGLVWAAFEDSVGAGLEDLEGDHFAIVWKDSAVLRQHSPQDYEDAVRCFHFAAKNACNPECNDPSDFNWLCVILA